jgi:hypothetical protein
MPYLFGDAVLIEPAQFASRSDAPGGRPGCDHEQQHNFMFQCGQYRSPFALSPE